MVLPLLVFFFASWSWFNILFTAIYTPTASLSEFEIHPLYSYVFQS
jgi:hypothetical protein